MQAQIITDRQKWNDFVASSELCNITQTYEWGELMSQRHSDYLPIGVIDESGELCAAMLVLISTLPGLHVPYFYAPRGPIMSDPASPSMTILLNFVKAEAVKRGICMLKIEPGVLEGDEQWLRALKHYQFRSVPYANHLRHEWVTDIRAAEDELLSKMHKKTRQYIRTSAKTDVMIRSWQGQADIDEFYRLYIETSERSEFMILSKEYYQNFMSLYKDNVEMLVAERGGRVIAAAIVVRLGRWCWNMYEAASDESRELRINYQLQWQRIRWAKAHGCWYFNSRGIPDVLEEGQELYGVYNFKRGFTGYAMRSLETHDLVYRPMVYEVYRKLLDAKHWYEQKRAERNAARIAALKKQAEESKPKTPQEPGEKKLQPAAQASTGPDKSVTQTKMPETPQPQTAVKPRAKEQQETQVPETPQPQTEVKSLAGEQQETQVPETPRPQKKRPAAQKQKKQQKSVKEKPTDTAEHEDLEITTKNQAIKQ